MTSATYDSEIYTIARCLKELVVNRQIDDALNNIVEWLAESLNIDRCYISEAGIGGGKLNGIYAGHARSFSSGGDIVFETCDFPEIGELLQQNQSFKVSVTDDISDELRQFLKTANLQSLLLIPLHTGSSYWGFIGFGDAINPRTWRRSEAELTSLASAIGAAVEASRSQHKHDVQHEEGHLNQVGIKEFSWKIDFDEHSIKVAGHSNLYVNDEATKSLSALKEFAFKRIHKDDAARVDENLNNFIFRKDNTAEEILRYLCIGTTEYTWVHCKLTKLFDSSGSLCGLAGAVTNVVDTQKVAYELEKQREQYQFLVRGVDQVIFTVDNRGNILHLAPSWLKLLGYTVEESLGINLIHFMPGSEVRTFCENFGKLLFDKQPSFEQQLQMLHKNGEALWVKLIAKSVKNANGLLTGVFGSIENIHANYSAELLLKESNDKLTTILNNSKEIILTIGLENNRIESVNEAISILGYSPEEWIGQRYHSWNDDQREKFHELTKLAVKSQLQVANQQISFSNKSKTEVITFEFSTNLFYYKNSKYLLCVLRDISQRLKYEQNLSRISQQLNHLINNIDDVYAIYDIASSSFEFVSNNVEALYKCSRQEFCSHGLVWNDIIHIEDQRRVKKAFANIFDTKGKDEFFYRISSGGEEKMILEKIAVGRNDKGEADKLYIVKTDYTHIEKIERSFIESERKFRFISENISDVISTHDPDWNFTYASPSVKNVLGYHPDELSGMSGFDFVHPDDLKMTLDELLQPLVLHRKETHLRYRIKARSGNYLWVETYSRAIVDSKGQTTSIISSTRDVTNQVLAENMLKTSEEQYRLLSENSNDVIATYDLQGKFTYVSPSSLQVLGYAPQELVGRCAADVLAKDDANRQLVNANMEGMEAIKEPRTFIYKALTKSGEEKSLEVVVQPVVKNGVVVSIQASGRDVTEREKLLIELEQSLAKERELNELRSMFVATASHQFRTPLTIIQSGVEIMEMYLEDLPESKQVRFQRQFSKIQSEVERLEFLMGDILVLGRANAARTPFNPETGNLEEFIKNILDEKYNNRYPDDRKVLLKVEGKVVDVDFDPKLIGHAVENIIANAYKYSEEGNLEVLLSFGDENVTIAITDHGMGIPEEEQKNLFQPFYRATNTNEIEGTGLGLAIVKEFVEKHKGKIFLTSKLNKGTTVSVILRVSQQL